MEVKVKQALENLDRNDFDQATRLVTQIMNDIKETIGDDYDMGMSLIEDYLYDLINPNLLDMESNNETI